MALSIELLKSMSPQHAINALRADFEPLTSTALEGYLIDWIEELVDQVADDEPVSEAMAEHDLEAADIEKLGDALIDDVETTVSILSLLHEHPLESVEHVTQCLVLDKVLADAGIDSPEALRAELDLAQKFRALANDAGDVFTRLSSLISQES